MGEKARDLSRLEALSDDAQGLCLYIAIHNIYTPVAYRRQYEAEYTPVDVLKRRCLHRRWQCILQTPVNAS